VQVKKSYLGAKTLMPLLELLFGAYFTGALWFAIDARIYTSVPFLFLFQVGFLYVGLSSLIQGRVKPAEAASSTLGAAKEEARRAA
jgi:hypothetical protein